MKLSLAVSCLLLTLNIGNARADCMPHHHYECSIILQYDTKDGQHLDSTSLLVAEFYHTPGEIVRSWDTVPEGGGHGTRFYGNGGSYYNHHPNSHAGLDTLGIWSRSSVDSFKILLHFHDHNRVSRVIIFDDRAMYRLAIEGDSVILTNPVAASVAAWDNYPSALLGTILIESLIALIYFRRRGVPLGKVHSIVTANLISHPILWASCVYLIGFGWGLVLGEIGITIFEGWWIWLFLKEFLSRQQCFKLSMLMNVLSFVLGGIIGLFVG
jgi:hypothetical protein